MFLATFVVKSCLNQVSSVNSVFYYRTFHAFSDFSDPSVSYATENIHKDSISHTCLGLNCINFEQYIYFYHLKSNKLTLVKWFERIFV